MAPLPTMKPLVNRNGETKPTKLKLDAIRLDAEIQTRVHIDESVVLEYSEDMARGDRFPPVVVFQVDQVDRGDFILVDGFHRLKAARRAKLGQILAEVRRGSRPDALRFALGANHKHGLRRTNGDKRRAVEMALAEFGNQSDRLLAEMCGVSQPFVSNLRHQLITVIGSKPRLGKDGKLRTLPVSTPDRSSVGGRTARTPLQSVDAGGSSGDAGNQAFIELADALAGVEEMAEKLVNHDPDKTEAVLAMIGNAEVNPNRRGS
jgi:uncharacterized ParB-like nuclease family protein